MDVKEFRQQVEDRLSDQMGKLKQTVTWEMYSEAMSDGVDAVAKIYMELNRDLDNLAAFFSCDADLLKFDRPVNAVGFSEVFA